MSKNLVIVESPAKAKTIEKFLHGDYHVLSSQGHIRDIEGVGRNSIGIDFNHNYQPNYVIDPGKESLIANLKKEAAKAEMIWLASDEDREGEAIAWHLQEVLQLPADRTRRIAFHEITETAIKEAIKHPRQVNYNIVNAQQARRVLDRIVGFELSPVLWRKVTTGLSAGRVQSVVVRLIVERERDIENFKETAQYRVVADFNGEDIDGKEAVLHTELNHRFNTKEEAISFLEQCSKAEFSISSIQTKPTSRQPASPFTTSLLQQEAARKLKFTVSKTMRLAQSLYEAGKITYMRTDSVNLSSLAIGTAKETIIAEYGERYHQARQFHTSSKGAQEAHEAIRPTYINVATAGQTQDEKRLYDLIRKRTLASQMANAEIENTRIEVSASGIPYIFVTTGETVLFDGFMRAYIQSNDEEQTTEASLLPRFNESTPVKTDEFVASQTFSKPPFRYNEATLIKAMEELGIGRPSTYNAIIETIQTRHYVERGNVAGHRREYNVLTMRNGRISDKMRSEITGQDSQKLLSTDLGRITNDFLVEQFPDILSYDFTAKEEENFDRIATGEAEWVEVVDTFYKTFHPGIERIPSGKVAGRLLGQDAHGAPVIAKISKIGPCIQLGDADCVKPKFVSLKKGQSVFTITLEEALALFEDAKPRVLATIDGKDVVAGEGKYGPYIRYDDRFISIPKGKNANEMSAAEIRTLIEEHHDAHEPLKEFGDIKVMKGRYGYYLKTEKGNFRLARSIDAEHLTEAECLKILEDQHSSTQSSKNNKRTKK
ncbi:MAG: type I DNA topoisomerase [Paludibacteraceae bacterium]|nr:type I DNA topoisomerase [Paludibacteraceae bacterium]